MGKRDSRIDVYIAQSAPFAQPILSHLRELIHQACPEVAETIKWGFPNFDYHGILCSMASFKQHCAFGFWKSSLLSDPHRILIPTGEEGMGHFGALKDVSELPPDEILLEYIREAALLNKQGVKKPAKPKASAEKVLHVPDYFVEALQQNPKALETFESFSYSHKKEYVEWVSEAKTEVTRHKRLATTLEWLTEGKGRNWKYEKK